MEDAGVRTSVACLLVALLAVVAIGCQSVPVKLETLKPDTYDVVGPAQGSATGIMLFNLIPIGQNERFEGAYQRAIQSKGADALIDIELSERWFWAYVLNGYTTTVKGTAVKKK